MKTAKFHVIVVDFSCPDCKESIVEPNSGSLMHILTELPEKLFCDSCKKELKIPKKVFKL